MQDFVILDVLSIFLEATKQFTVPIHVPQKFAIHYAVLSFVLISGHSHEPCDLFGESPPEWEPTFLMTTCCHCRK